MYTELVVDLFVHGVFVRPLNILHTDAGYKMFATKPVAAVNRGGNFYRALVYSDSGVLPQKLKWYREPVMPLTVDGFNVYVNDLPDKDGDGDEKERTVWVLRALFRAC